MGNNQGLCATAADTGRMKIRSEYTEVDLNELDAEWTICHAPVFLNVYHLNEKWQYAHQVSEEILGFGGAFHVGVEIFGREYAYTLYGISVLKPRKSTRHIFYKSILIGETQLTQEEVKQMIKDLRPEWQGADYDLLACNCLNFAEALCQGLVGSSMPPWVSRFPQMASAAAATMEGTLDIKRFTKPDKRKKKVEHPLPAPRPVPAPPANLDEDWNSPTDESILKMTRILSL
mmetsp:Transcript_26776/g.46442  ORF Transcript_26776/g.46442 Transcript_26776/m.46442 type:complete len:232 (-) Transcript_26776:185-880(-)